MSELDMMIDCYEKACDGLEKQNKTLRDERDRLAKALKAFVNEVGSYTVERQYYSREEASKDLDRREKALLAQLQQAKAALTPAGQRLTPNEAME